MFSSTAMRRLSRVAAPLQSVGTASEAQTRLALEAAILGCFVGDAAAVTSHWVYDQSSLSNHVNGTLGGEQHAPFMEPINPFYHVRPGKLSCYGDQTLALLRSMAAAGKGASDLGAYMQGLDLLCGEATEYGPLGRKIEKDDMPIQGPWRHGSLKEYFANVKAGESDPSKTGGEDKQIDGACKIAPIVASFGALGLGPTLTAAEAAIRVTQDSDEAVSMGLAFARILYAVAGERAQPADAVLDCIDALRQEDRLQPCAL